MGKWNVPLEIQEIIDEKFDDLRQSHSSECDCEAHYAWSRLCDYVVEAEGIRAERDDLRARIAELEAKQDWTRELPEESGYYWVSQNSDPWVSGIVYVDLGCDEPVVAGMDGEFRLAYFKGASWLGPIREPSRPAQPEEE